MYIILIYTCRIQLQYCFTKTGLYLIPAHVCGTKMSLILFYNMCQDLLGIACADFTEYFIVWENSVFCILRICSIQQLYSILNVRPKC